MNNKLQGLSEKEVLELTEKYGKNVIGDSTNNNFFRKILEILSEPMFILLFFTSIIYFILGEPLDGMVMLFFILGIIFVDIIQGWKTDQTLKKLKELSSPKIEVIREGKKEVINSGNLVPGDLIYIYEGVKIPADGMIVKNNSLSIDESSLTGESEPVWKNLYHENSNKEYFRDDYCYASTLVIQGSGIVKITSTGSNTEYGKIGVNISKIEESPSTLQIQTRKLIKIVAMLALVFCLLTMIITYINLSDYMFKDRIIESILSGITLAMSMIPEEFPVVLTVFLSMGAWRLAKKHSLIKKISSIETLGAISVLCVDKTGTITKNEMTVVKKWSVNNDNNELLETIGLCCDEDTYDPMEKAMLESCEKEEIFKDHIFGGTKLKEYPFSNKNKMMGAVWNHDDLIILAVKGSYENIIDICNITKNELDVIKKEAHEMSSKGLRVIGVAKKILENDDDIKNNLLDYKLEFIGLIGLVDPPREGVKKDISLCYKAGIRVVMITGDNGKTASSIAENIGIKNSSKYITGNMLTKMSDSELQEAVKTINIFSRVIPEHKMRIIEAFQRNGQIVGMTGDGVNDAPALKKANIGIAMGKRGTEVSREAADLILMDDNFRTIVDTVKDGRRIYDNIKRAVNYIIIIHIPIALACLIAPLLGIPQSGLLFLPIHIVLLELIIDPTSSIVFEREPAESNIMNRLPRNVNASLLNKNNLFKSIIQGIIIFIVSFGAYYYLLINNYTPEVSRTVGLLILVYSNLFLVLVNSSNTELVITNIKKIILDKVIMSINLVIIFMSLILVYTPVNSFFKLSSIPFYWYLLTIIISFGAVFWYELVKLIKKK